MSTSSHDHSTATPSAQSNPPPSPVFATTRWSVVVQAGRADTPRARVALEQLCQSYWYPLYAYVRRRGYSPEDAEDLTQEFFTRLLQRHAMAKVEPEKGRFRSFLLASMNHFLADEWDKARALKRGGGKVISIDLASVETRLRGIPANRATPEKDFERRWAIALLEKVYRQLSEEYRAENKAVLFEALRATLAGRSESAPYAEIARELNLSEGAVKVAVHRLRRRYRDLLREIIADTVAEREEVEDEIRHLFRAVSAE